MNEMLEALRASGELADIDVHFAQLATRLADSDALELWLGAGLASRATASGHVCVDLAELAGTGLPPERSLVTVPSAEKLRAVLGSSAVVTSPERAREGERRPLVLDDRDRLYLYRYWHYQSTLAESLLALVRDDTGSFDAGSLRERLDALFPRDEPADATDDAMDGQKVAAAVAAMRRLCIVSGGPGTGKTTTVTKILALLVGASPERPPRIALAAPTGKAAARMVAAIREAKARLGLDDGIAAAIPDDAKTLHRLLGYRHGSVRFRHHRDAPLPLDVVVVDEASMVDLAMMAKLVDALPPHARLILIGDRDQLASVEAGAVLGDLCAKPTGFSRAMASRLAEVTGESVPAFDAGQGAGDAAEPPAIADSIVLLTRSYRFSSDSGIGAAALAVNAGDAERAIDVLDGDAAADVTRSDLDALDAVMQQAVVEAWDGLASENDPARAFEAFDRLRVLCARRTGPFGVAAMNGLVESILSDRGRIDRRNPWYRGRPVLVTENDYGLRLFNGDIGIVMPDPDSGGVSRVVFPADDQGFRKLAPARLPAHETAFAMTVHKSQGSEFDHVVFVLPDEPSPLLTRELVYTGLTRARSRVSMLADPPILRAAIERAVRRSSGLRDALWGATGDPDDTANVSPGSGSAESPERERPRASDASKSRASVSKSKPSGDEGQLTLF